MIIELPMGSAILYLSVEYIFGTREKISKS